MATLLGLSAELIHCILIETDPVDLFALSLTCRSFNAHIKGNMLLHKELYIRRYDQPGKDKGEMDWEPGVHRAVRLEKLLESSRRSAKTDEMEFIFEEIIMLLETASADQEQSSNVKLISDYFLDPLNCDALLCASGLWRTGGTQAQRPAPTPKLRQASAKLHCLYGKAIEPVPSVHSTFTFNSMYTNTRFMSHAQLLDFSLPPSAGTRAKEVSGHTVARAKVYDLRQYTRASLWGPFLDDGSHFVDWEKLEAVMMVLAFNLRKTHERDPRWPLIWDEPFVGATPHSYVSPQVESHPTPTKLQFDDDSGSSGIQPRNYHNLTGTADPDLAALDPYGVTGSWLRVVCFLDYNDLYAFNFSERIPDDQARAPIDIEEATRLICLKLRVTRVDPPGTGDERGKDDGLDWSAFKDPNANSRIRGSVRQTPEGQIRWTTFSIFHGEERWRSEGIQVGGLRSARGVLGNWFDKDYDQHGPAGPTAFWKVADELDDELPHNHIFATP